MAKTLVARQRFVADSANLLSANGLRCFRDIWTLAAEWFEAPNAARSGWSGASRVVLQIPGDGTLPVFLKRQQDHCTRSLRAPFGMPTFRREFENIQRLLDLGIPAVPALYYGEEEIDGHSCAAIITVALDDYESFDCWWPSHPEPFARHAVLHALAHWTAQFSRQRLQHGCLYDKHIFIRKSPANEHFGNNHIRFIDLEKMRHRLSVKKAAQLNQEQLLRRTPQCSSAEHEYLAKAFVAAMTDR